MRSPHEHNALSTLEYSTEMHVRIISRAKDCHLADKATQTMGDEDERARWPFGPISRQIVQKVRGMVDQPVRSRSAFLHYVRVVAVREYARCGEL